MACRQQRQWKEERLELAACACVGGKHTSPARAVGSYVIRKALAYFFVNQVLCVAYKKYDKAEAAAGSKARQIIGSGWT